MARCTGLRSALSAALREVALRLPEAWLSVCLLGTCELGARLMHAAALVNCAIAAWQGGPRWRCGCCGCTVRSHWYQRRRGGYQRRRGGAAVLVPLCLKALHAVALTGRVGCQDGRPPALGPPERRKCTPCHQGAGLVGFELLMMGVARMHGRLLMTWTRELGGPKVEPASRLPTVDDHQECQATRREQTGHLDGT